MRLFGLKISPATILDLTRRAADAIQPEYDASSENPRRNDETVWVENKSRYDIRFNSSRC
jgi:hypothetical protein